MADNEALWDYDDVAEYLKNSPLTVEKWANERRLPVVKIGVLNRFVPDVIRTLAVQGKIPAAAGHYRVEEERVGAGAAVKANP